MLVKKLKKYGPKGFTLIELLIVVAILGTLAAITTITIGNARARARDSQRKADLAVIKQAIQAWTLGNNDEPPPSGSTDGEPQCKTTGNDIDLKGARLVSGMGELSNSVEKRSLKSYLAAGKIPSDPIANLPNQYNYWYWAGSPDGSEGHVAPPRLSSLSVFYVYGTLETEAGNRGGNCDVGKAPNYKF
jgi:prepilin-type N-terminal cleavage/methylation domain-containing protein